MLKILEADCFEDHVVDCQARKARSLEGKASLSEIYEQRETTRHETYLLVVSCLEEHEVRKQLRLLYDNAISAVN